jgi:DNA replication protein DnaC
MINMCLRSHGEWMDEESYRGDRFGSPPTSPRPGDVVVDVNGYPTNLKELLDFLQQTKGVKMFKEAYRRNMLYKQERYDGLVAEAQEEVDRQAAIIKDKRPQLKKVAGISEKEKADGASDNWSIFEKIGSPYLESRDRLAAFRNIRQRAADRLHGSLNWDDLKQNDRAFELRDELVASLRALSTFSSQPHIVASVIDIVGAFIKNPKLLQTKFMNFVLVGASGTGKTTFAQAIAKVFAAAGMFAGDKVVDAGRAEFVGEYEGQTVARTRRFLESNLDRGVVFIDEAYAITPWDKGKPEGYGSEAATAMVEHMTRYKGLYCIITAGYEKEMTRYFLTSNPGMPRRFPYRFVMRELSPDDLLRVFRRTLLTEQGITPPVSHRARLDSEDYFDSSAWHYLRELTRICSEGTWGYQDEEFDKATGKMYTHVKTFEPSWPRMYTLFEHQAGSMTNLAEEAIIVLMRTITYSKAAQVHAKTQGVARATIDTQEIDVMRKIVAQRITNSALSEADEFFQELDDVEALIL